MSRLIHLAIRHVRNLESVDLEPSSGFNVFYGNNGSGKSSLLEAIHYLGFGRSFRTRHHNRVISHEQSDCVIYAKVSKGDSIIPVGLQRDKTGAAVQKLSGYPCKLQEIADILPILLIHPDGHKLLAGGPKYRRHYLDWGLFHVEHQFYHHWQRAQRALKHRNTLLKNGVARYQDLAAWDREFSESSENINQARKKYLALLLPILEEMIANMSLSIPISAHYYPGWPESDNISFATRLEQSFYKDKQYGFTQYGPHKSDIYFRVKGKPAYEMISQGQLKMIIYAMKLTQSATLKQHVNKSSIYLIDDLPAELDILKRTTLYHLLSQQESQVFVTGIAKEDFLPLLEDPVSKMFHVEHGKIQDCLPMFHVEH